MNGDDGFLERWSRRKAVMRQTDSERPVTSEHQTASAPDGAAPRPDAAMSPDKVVPVTGTSAPSDREPITEEELAALPPVETLTTQSDLRPFLRPGVPAALKNAAMRRMWLLTPAIRDHKDCAVDYAWDWNTPGGVPGNGGQLSTDSVARMLGDLAKPACETEPARESDARRDETSTDQPDPSPAATTRASRHTEAEPPDPGTKDADAREHGRNLPSGAERQTPAGRRHGGAMPV